MSERAVGAVKTQGEASLLEGDFHKATWCFDSALYLSPSLGATLWQRGLACFYSGHYKEAMLQFQADMAENGNDVEEVIWHFLCCCRLYGFEQAQASFLPLSSTPTVAPMLEILHLYQGRCTVSEVLAASTKDDGTAVESYNGTSALAYAHFYIGLYHEMRREIKEAQAHLKTAAEMDNPDYMGKLMQMHHQLFMKTTFPSAKVPVFSLGQKQNPKGAYRCSSIIQGGWQLSKGHLIHKEEDRGEDGNRLTDIVSSLLVAFDSGITTFDCGDIYTGVEELYGALIKAHCKRGGLEEDISIHTKLVPDLDAIKAGKVDGDYIRVVVRRSLNRLGVKSVSLVQFHWWDFSVPGYVEAASTLHVLAQESGCITQIGLTNFDTQHMQEVLDSGVPIATNQVQYSLLDRRPLLSGLVALCERHGVKILAYGVLAGGFLSDSWLGAPCPKREGLANRSLVKYLLIIEEFGGWELFQELLGVLRRVADRHSPQTSSSEEEVGLAPEEDGPAVVGARVSIAMVSMQYILQQDQVGAVIIGAHSQKHLTSTVSSVSLKLTARDVSEIEAVLARSGGPSGAVFGLERAVSGAHSSIMKYNLNQLNQAPHLEELCHRYLHLYFEAHPSEATRVGYRFPPSQDYSSFCHELCSGVVPFSVAAYHPSSAASRGCNYDHHLSISSQGEIQAYCDKLELFLKEARGIEEESLSTEQLVDLKIILSQLELELVKWNELKTHKKDPSFYLPLNAILYLLPAWGSSSHPPATTSLVPSLSEDDETRGYNNSTSLAPQHCWPVVDRSDCSLPGVADMPISQRLVALLSRLRGIPKLLQVAQANLTAPMLVFVETALEIAKSFASFLVSDLPTLCKSLVLMDPATDYTPMLGEIEHAAKIAGLCVQKYEAFIQESLVPKASSATGVGKDIYERVLKYSHFIDSSEELLALGEEHFQSVKDELEVLAKEIDPTKSWQEITEKVIRPKHPSAANLLSAYLSEIQRAKHHTLAHNLVSSLPAGERVVGFYTPKFLLPFSPFGDFLNPSPFAGMGEGSASKDYNVIANAHQVGHLMLHSVEAQKLSSKEEEKLLQAHDYTWISVIAPHESYPGHHVQALLAQKHPRILRKYYESILFYEGWGLYTEELAYETGFFEKEQEVGNKDVVSVSDFAKLARLTQLRLRLWRAARIILDVKLNTGEMSFEDCQEFLHREVMFNPRSSRGETFIYASRPGYAPCYVAGYLLLMRLREQAKEKCALKGVEFSLTKFHDTVLSKGCIPFKLLEMLMQ